MTELLKFGKESEKNELSESQCNYLPVGQNPGLPLTPPYLVFASCETVFSFIEDNQRLKLGDSISEQAREGKIDSSIPWLELRHFLGRLHSYLLAVKTMLRARLFWDRLCHDTKVTVIPSATTIPHPLKNKRPTAYEIIGRMTSDDGLLATYRSQAEKLQELKLDEIILAECNSASQTHMVHAEILVLDYVLGYLRDTEDVQFYNGWRYIGTCKPVCRLCHYYFMAHPSTVHVRETSNNLYPHWRIPDVFGEKAMTETEKYLQAVIVKTRADAIQSLKSQTLQGRRYDSNSFSEMPPPFASVRTETPSISDLNSRFSGLKVIPEENGRSAVGERGDEEEEKIDAVFRGRRSVLSRR